MPTASFDFANSVVLVTGGTKGLGRGIAQRFAECGATVAVCARREPSELPDGWHFEVADLRDGEQAMAMVDRVVERCGRLDVVVNNAGGGLPMETTSAPPALTEKVIALNLASAMFVSQAANRHMQNTAGGAIVNIGSVVSHRASVGVAAYGAAKAGLANYTRTVGQEWAPKVRTNMISVGMIRTESAHLAYGDDESIARIETTIPVGRLVTPREVGDVCMFLASDQAAYITGADLVMDGGGDRPTWLGALAT